MPVSTSEGKYYDSHEDMLQEQLFGSRQPQEPEEQPKVFGIRHGCTDLNDENKIHGWVDEPLNEQGIEQAHKAADSLKDKELTKLVSSPLPRAMQTTRIIAKKLGIPFEVDPRLMTFDSGDFDYTDKHDEFEKYTRASSKPGRVFQQGNPSPLHIMGHNIDPEGSDEDYMKMLNFNEIVKESDENRLKDTANQFRRNKKFNQEDMPVHFQDLSSISQRDI